MYTSVGFPGGAVMLSANEQGRAVIDTKVTVRRFKGALRSHDEAACLGVIDTRIRGLVEAFNVPGVVASISSCEGHRYLGLPIRRPPFVSFFTTPSIAARFAAHIRRDQEGSTALHYYWKVSGTFNTENILLFTLDSPVKFYWRRKLDADIARLSSWAEEIFQPGPFQ